MEGKLQERGAVGGDGMSLKKERDGSKREKSVGRLG